MKLIQQSAELLACPTRDEALDSIEHAGRTCYKSESHGDPAAFVRSIIKRGHLSVIEHCSASFHLVTNRGVTHELVRHRPAAYSQESTRYCNYSKDKFDGQLTFIEPVWWDESYAHQRGRFVFCCQTAEREYLELLEAGWTAQQAREVLPNSLKTEIVMTANFREWLYVIELRTSAAAHPQIRQLIGQVRDILAARIPEIFGEQS